MTMPLEDLLKAQLELEMESFGCDPRALSGDALADFFLWNSYALADEMHEAGQELKWKTWLTDGSRGEFVNREAYLKELVDAFHFFMNLLLAGAEAGQSAGSLADDFCSLYFQKHKINARRQELGYDGSKDAQGRATDDDSTLGSRINREARTEDPRNKAHFAEITQKNEDLKAKLRAEGRPVMDEVPAYQKDQP